MYATLLLALLMGTVGLQEPDADANYRQEFAKYSDILEVADPAEKATQFLDFADAGFDERLLGGVAAGIQESLTALAGAGRLDELYPLADRWDAQTGEIYGAAISLQAAAGAGDHERITKYGEIVYAVQPVVDIAEILAASFNALGNTEKYLEYANITINEKGLGEAFDFAFNIYETARNNTNWSEASDWASRLKGLGSAPAGVSAAEWRDMNVDFQTTIARAAYEAERNQDAIREFQALQSMGRDQRGIANFYLGQIYLRTEQFAVAMDRFADASVVNDATYSTPARRMLEEIYRTNTGGTLEGLNENVLNAARARMR